MKNTQNNKVEGSSAPMGLAGLALKIAILLCAMVATVTLLTLSACAPGNTGNTESDKTPSNSQSTTPEPDTSGDPNPKVQITMEDGATIDLTLDRAAAPITVTNFLKLVNAQFYDGLTFHRVIDGFMIQGGDPQGTGAGGSSETIKGEFASNGWTANTISHKRGVISMARSSSPDSASSQFFITNADSPHLDGSYAAFGTVTAGMDEVDKIAKAAKDASDKPLVPVKIKTIRVVG